MSKIDRATDLLAASDDANCFPMQLFSRESFTVEELTALLEIGYKKFKSRHSSMRLGPNQYLRAILGCLERMERDLSPTTFDESNYRERTISPLMNLIDSGFKRLYKIVNKQHQ